MKKRPNNRGRELKKARRMTALQIREAMNEASQALDAQSQEITALKRILISERAQVIYYSDKYLAFLRHECVDVAPVNFLDLEEAQQEPYIKRAIKELSDAQGIVPHDKDALEAQQHTATVAKKIILPN